MLDAIQEKKYSDIINVELPVTFLLHVATYGNMGTGEMAEFASRKAKQVLISNGYEALVNEALDKKLEELRKSLTNILGAPNMEKINRALELGAESVKEVSRRLKDENT
jgi:hypothetical protein